MKKQSSILILIFVFVALLIIIPVSFLTILKIQQTQKINAIKKEMTLNLRENKILFDDLMDELTRYDYIYFTKEKSVIKALYFDENGEKQNILLSNYDDKFNKTINLFEKFEICNISKYNDNFYFTYKTDLPFSFNLVYLVDKNEKTGHKLENLEKITDNWYYAEEH